jgi:hypothetical protein
MLGLCQGTSYLCLKPTGQVFRGFSDTLSFIKFMEVLHMQEGCKYLGHQFGVVRLCTGAVL